MLLNGITLYFFAGIVVTLYLLMYLIANGKSIYSNLMAALACFISIYTFGYMMELHSRTIEDVMFWSRFEYLALPFLNATWLMLALVYAGVFEKVTLKTALWLYAVPVVTFFMRMTNPVHHLYYKSYELVERFGLTVLKTEKGPWYLVQSGYILLTTFAIVAVFYRVYYKSTPGHRKMFRHLLVASVLPVMGLVLQIWNPYGLSLDYSVFILPWVVAAIAFAVIKNNFLEMRSLARAEIFENSPNAVLVENRNGRLVDYNLKAVAFFKLHGIELAQAPLAVLCEDCLELYQQLKSEQSIVLYNLKGTNRYWDISKRSIRDQNDLCIGRILLIDDVSDKIKVQKKLEYQSETDVLTDLNNRRAFMTKGSAQLNAGRAGALMMLDIDFFKRINDTYGHLEGDAVLKKLGQMLRTFYRDGHIVGRFGGEEFVVLSTGVSKSEAVKMATEFKTSVERTAFLPAAPDDAMTVSIGVAVYETDDTLEMLIQKADEALYAAKETGRNRVVSR